MNGFGRDFANLALVDEAESLMRFHDDAIEKILAGNLQDVFDRPERVTLSTLYRSANFESKVRNLMLVIHSRTALVQLRNAI